MAKQKPYRKDDIDNAAAEATHLAIQPSGLFGGIPRERIPLIVLFFTVTIGSFVVWSMFGRSPILEMYTYEKIAEYTHDMDSFTQGLIHENGFVYESTGQRGESKLRKITLETGFPVKEVNLASEYFGEGLCRVGDQLIQLTWQEYTGFVYDMDLNKVKEFQYDFEGWGLTYDGIHLIASDGTSQLRFMDPETFDVVRKIYVRKGASRMPGINELEYINGKVYANVYGENMIYIISPTDGKVTGSINFQDLFDTRTLVDPREMVFNGIALRKDNGNLLVTGKNWPKVYEVKVKPVDLQ